MVEHVVAGGQAGRVDVGVAEVDVPVGVEESDVVAESAGGELRMLQDPDDGVLLVVELLGAVEAAGVPLSHSGLQQAARNSKLDSGSTHLKSKISLRILEESKHFSYLNSLLDSKI